MTILDQIVDAGRRRLAEERPDFARLQRIARERRRGAAPHRFAAAISGTAAPRIIAEIKAASPSAGDIILSPDVEAISGDYAAAGAAAVSVVAERDFFRGSREWLDRAARASGLPVIMKEFVVEPVQIVEGIAAGADAVLLLTSLLDEVRLRDAIALLDDLSCDALVEVHDERELERAVGAGARLIGVNNRDLRTFEVSLETSERLASMIPTSAIRVAESGIRNSRDIARLRAAGYHAFLVGESLLRSGDRSAALRALQEVA
jgi:indole-3-glycerol phosphate synthase